MVQRKGHEDNCNCGMLMYLFGRLLDGKFVVIAYRCPKCKKVTSIGAYDASP